MSIGRSCILPSAKIPTLGKTVAIADAGGIPWSSYWATRTVTGLTITVDSDTQFTLNWVNNGGADWTGTKVYISTDNVTYIINKTVTSISTSTTVTGLTAGTLYYLKVAPYKGSNVGGMSEVAVSVTDAAELRDGNTVADFDAFNASSITKDASNFVSAWMDKLGSGVSVVQADDTKKPKHQNDNSIVFNGIDDTLVGTFTFNQPEYIYKLIRVRSWVYGYKLFDGIGSSNRGSVYQLETTPGIKAYAGSFSTQNNNLTLLEFHVLKVLFNGANSKMQIDDTAEVNFDAGTQNMGGITFGASYYPNGWTNYDDIETILRKTADNEAVKSNITTYLNSKKALFNYQNNQSGYGHVKLASMPLDLNQHGFEACNGKLYAIAGSCASLSANTKQVYEYNPLTNEWVTKTPMPIAEVGVQSGVLRAIGNKLYFIGGLLTGLTLTGKTWLYDPIEDSWTEKTAMPTPREDFGSFVLDGKIYVFGGLKDPSHTTPTNIMEVYDPATDTWDQTKADLPVAKWSGDFGVSCNGRGYAISSSNTMTGYPVCVTITTVYEYNPTLDSWSEKAPIPQGCMYKECESIGTDIYVVGGQIDGDYRDCNRKTKSIYKYNTLTDEWSLVSHTPYSVFGVGVAKLNDELYMSGGAFNLNYSELWKLNL